MCCVILGFGFEFTLSGFVLSFDFGFTLSGLLTLERLEKEAYRFFIRCLAKLVLQT